MRRLLKDSRLRAASGFTLIELLLVIVIIGILSGVLIAVINPVQTRRRANESVLRSNLDKICLAMQACAAARSDPLTTCYNSNFGTFSGLIGVNTPTSPTGATWTVGNVDIAGAAAANNIAVTGTLVTGTSTCRMRCIYDTSTGVGYKTAIAQDAGTSCLAE